MTIHDKRRSVLARAAGVALYSANEGDKGGGAGDDKKDPADKGRDDSAIMREFQAMKEEIAALREASEKRERRRKRKEDEAEAEEGEGDEDGEDELSKARVDVAAAKQEADQFKREARDLRVGVMLRDHLKEKYKDYEHAADYILPVIVKELGDEPKPAEINRLIADHAKAFAERMKKAGPAHGAPAGGTRGKLPGGSVVGAGAVSGEDRGMKPDQRTAPANAPRFQTINWHG